MGLAPRRRLGLPLYWTITKDDKTPSSRQTSTVPLPTTKSPNSLSPLSLFLPHTFYTWAPLPLFTISQSSSSSDDLPPSSSCIFFFLSLSLVSASHLLVSTSSDGWRALAGLAPSPPRPRAQPSVGSSLHTHLCGISVSVSCLSIIVYTSPAPHRRRRREGWASFWQMNIIKYTTSQLYIHTRV